MNFGGAVKKSLPVSIWQRAIRKGRYHAKVAQWGGRIPGPLAETVRRGEIEEINQHSGGEGADVKQIAGVPGKLKWGRQDAAACSPSLQLLDRSDLTIDALLACSTQPICPTTPTFIFHMSSKALVEHGTGEKKAQSPKGEASTAQNSSSPKSIMNHVEVGGTLKTTKPSAFYVGGTDDFTGKTCCKNSTNFDQTSVVAVGCSATGATGATSDTGATGATSTTSAQEGDGVERPSALCATDSNTEQESMARLLLQEHYLEMERGHKPLTAGQNTLMLIKKGWSTIKLVKN